MAKINNTQKCLDLLDKQRGDQAADIEAKGQDDWTSLHYSAFNGNHQLLTYLLYHDAVIDALTKERFTPLILACQR